MHYFLHGSEISTTGAYVFYTCERSRGWTYFNSVYFTFISLLAIGYGDVTLSTMAGKSFFVLWSLIVVPTLTMLISTGTEAIGYPFLMGMRSKFRYFLLSFVWWSILLEAHDCRPGKIRPSNLRIMPPTCLQLRRDWITSTSVYDVLPDPSSSVWGMLFVN